MRCAQHMRSTYAAPPFVASSRSRPLHQLAQPHSHTRHRAGLPEYLSRSSSICSTSTGNTEGDSQLPVKRRPYHPALTQLPEAYWPANPDFDKDAPPPPEVVIDYNPLAFQPAPETSEGGFTAADANDRASRLAARTDLGPMFEVPASPAKQASLRSVGDGLYVVLFQNNYRWALPSISWQDGKFKVDAGMFDTANRSKYMNALGLVYLPATTTTRVLQVVYGSLYLAAHALVFYTLYQLDSLFSLALVYSWLRQRLTLARLALLVALAAWDRSWLYWVFALGKWVDNWLELTMPPVRRFFVCSFVVWLTYLILSPSSWAPLPFNGFAPPGASIQDVLARMWLLR